MSEFAQGDPGCHEASLITAREQLKLIEQNLLALQAAPGDLETLEAIFRGLHHLKAGPGFPGLDRAQTLARVGGKVLGRLREGRIRVDAQVIELLFQTEDLLRILVEQVGARSRGQGIPDHPDADGLIARLESLLPS